MKYDAVFCVKLLCEKSFALREKGEDRLPRRTDFSKDEETAIKAYLGPWPRALEKAGLKPENADRALQKKLRREALKRRKGQAEAEEKGK